MKKKNLGKFPPKPRIHLIIGDDSRMKNINSILRFGDKCRKFLTKKIVQYPPIM